jgi:hypothetical protein
MKTISLIGIALALCAPALASAQRGGGGGATVQRGDVQRVDIRRVDIDRGLVTAREVRRGDVMRDTTGTRIRRPDVEPERRRLHNPARRRWYNATHPANPHKARRRWWNATHPPAPDRSRRRGG